MPRKQSASRSGDLAAAKKGKKGKKGGGLVGLIKRKPLEATGAAAAVVAVVLYVAHRNSASQQQAPGGPAGYIAPALQRSGPGGGNGGFENQIQALQRQLDELTQR